MLQQAQIDCYHEQGWLGVEDVLSREDVESLRRVTQEFVEKSRTVTVSDTFLIWSRVTALLNRDCVA